ncbi:hypothetical protein NKDENANG_03403 [Candidatus Entotheonellaceae bacterium PAL068K]
MSIAKYLKELNRQFSAGTATEHTHRPALKALLESAIPRALVTNEPRQIACGAPDFVLTRNGIPLGYIEAKDIDKNLDDPAHKEQLNRYTESLDNLIFTNYTEFRLFRDGRQVAGISIAKVSGNHIKPGPDNFDAFTDILKTFAGYEGQTITTAADLAGRMAVKARMLAGVITGALKRDTDEPGRRGEMEGALQGQLEAFRKHLIHDIDAAAFADIYAQTVAYGLFAARLHDPSPDTFTRQEAAELIPSTNPFLRRFFQHIAGYDLDERIHWIVDDLADLFRAADVGELMKDYGKATQQNDPFLHFYETFLGQYDPKLRKSRGVYYTPEPVVNFIVRAVDEILQTEFNLSAGLADTGKTIIEIQGGRPPTNPAKARLRSRSKEVHRVQILDPATGTGTFLAAIVQQIYHGRFLGQKGIWPDYVRKELIPRLNGFEVLMASYAMAHAKLEMVLRDSGCELGNERLRLFLTNSLGEHHPDTATPFAQWLSTEANEANFIKRDTPVMVVIGNPPYSGESANKGGWITDLLQDYKQEPGGGRLQEKNSKMINDDYVKFIRYGQHHIDRNGVGVLAYINNHSFLDNITFRGMRWSLLQSFDTIYILDLHGNSRKKETAPDGSADKNVFDIQQGVCINLFVKTGKKNPNAPARVFHYDLYGQRESKYEFLWDRNLKQVGFNELKPQSPQYFFVPKDYELQSEYDKGFSVNDIFPLNGTGVVTKRDKLSIHHGRTHALQAAKDILEMPKDEFYRKYSLPADVRDWRYEWAKDDIKKFGIRNKLVQEINYRPFDKQYIVYTGKTRGFIGWPVFQIMRHFIEGENVGLVTSRITKDNFSVLCTKHITAHKSATLYDRSYIFPLYLYPDDKQQNWTEKQTRKPNLDKTIVQTIAAGLGLRFTPEKEADPKTFAPIDLLDYIYAVLHSPAYRQRYTEFLKIDFPRVPYSTDKKQFRKLVKLGGELRALHLLESPALDTLITGYPETGDNTVTQPAYKLTDTKNRLGRVHINKTQYFEGVPEVAWNFHIGGYQPAQKWLKDRKAPRPLSHDDIIHYQKIIVALAETDRLMQEIDKLSWFE